LREASRARSTPGQGGKVYNSSFGKRHPIALEASQLKAENNSLVVERREVKAVYKPLLFEYRELEKERQKAEAREQRLLQQLERAQRSQTRPSSKEGYPGDLCSTRMAWVTSSAGSVIPSGTVSDHSRTITPSGQDRPATAILSTTMNEPAVSATSTTTACWPCGLGLAGSAEGSGLMNTDFLGGGCGIVADVSNVTGVSHITTGTTIERSGVLGSESGSGVVSVSGFCYATGVSGSSYND